MNTNKPGKPGNNFGSSPPNKAGGHAPAHIGKEPPPKDAPAKLNPQAEVKTDKNAPQGSGHNKG
ncbi:hypothetical protein RQP53_00310 [Paucibacter sp. APW11]|uniref:Uncharacterized protein n=1 Tax=Roseateles aquae TaxID=3077235 RepID=A0ABU3P668_9BURK|nr:hypothetical protein [Paucibacter sp. APW11]MDT8997710.1 hypothetical protein [Paucibacter sp. APW11]